MWSFSQTAQPRRSQAAEEVDAAVVAEAARDRSALSTRILA